MVAVISSNGIRLMPTSNYRARKLLAGEKAIVQGFNPFTETSGSHNKGTRIMVAGKSVSVRKVKLKQYRGAYTTITQPQKGEKDT